MSTTTAIRIFSNQLFESETYFMYASVRRLYQSKLTVHIYVHISKCDRCFSGVYHFLKFLCSSCLLNWAL
jgi:hypothetical protein